MKTTNFLMFLVLLPILTYGHNSYKETSEVWANNSTTDASKTSWITTVPNYGSGNSPQQQLINGVELSSFKASVDEGKVQLQWVTTQEVINNTFTIERSNNGADFIAAGTITSNEIAKTTMLFDFNDESPLLGKSFYRLKLTNHDGSYTYSKIVFVMVDDKVK